MGATLVALVTDVPVAAAGTGARLTAGLCATTGDCVCPRLRSFSRLRAELSGAVGGSTSTRRVGGVTCSGVAGVTAAFASMRGG